VNEKGSGCLVQIRGVTLHFDAKMIFNDLSLEISGAVNALCFLGPGEYFKLGATRPPSQFASPVRFAFPDTNERRFSRSWSLSTFVRTWSRLCAPDSVRRICCFFTIQTLLWELIVRSIPVSISIFLGQSLRFTL
jgi:hypothetical protein